MTLETELREALRDAADATPVPDRWSAIVSAAHPRARRVRVALGFVAIAAIVALVAGVIAVRRADRHTPVVSAGAPRRAGVVTFGHGPTVDLGALARGKLAFVSGSRVYVADADAGNVHRLTKAGDASAFAWSADGQWLAFSVRDAPGYEDYTTWVTRPDGTGARALTGLSDTFAWSPSGHRLAIAGGCCFPKQNRGGVLVVDPGGATKSLVRGDLDVSALTWSPDGRTIGYTLQRIGALNAGVWTIGATGGRATLVDRADGQARAQLEAWSPDGRTMLVLRTDAAGSHAELVDVATHARRDLGPALAGVWSPSGDALAIVASGAPTDPSETILVCRGDGGSCRARAALSLTSGRVGPLVFSPDGTRLTYVAGRRLWVLPAAGGRPRALDDVGLDLLQGGGDGVHVTRAAGAVVPFWLPDGSILYGNGPELRVVDPRGGVPLRVAAPVGYDEAGARRQGLPGGTPAAAWRLALRSR